MNWMRQRLLYFIISLTVIGAGLFGFFKWGFLFGVDFKGGSILEYRFEKQISEEEIAQEIKKEGYQVTAIQKTREKTYLIRTSGETKDARKLDEVLKKSTGGGVENLRLESVGPSIGPELIKKTVYALLIASLGILIWISIQFRSFKFGVSATLATFHDSLVLLGSFSLLGHFFGAEVNFLFVTAVLTVLSFSVHDTIVVYDRIRESQKKIGGSLYDLANRAISETMVRSLNNSFTIIFMLIALVLLGGSTIKWFAVALLIGTISGTYSSPFVAVPLLVTWDEIEKKIKKA